MCGAEKREDKHRVTTMSTFTPKPTPPTPPLCQPQNRPKRRKFGSPEDFNFPSNWTQTTCVSRTRFVSRLYGVLNARTAAETQENTTNQHCGGATIIPPQAVTTQTHPTTLRSQLHSQRGEIHHWSTLFFNACAKRNEVDCAGLSGESGL